MRALVLAILMLAHALVLPARATSPSPQDVCCTPGCECCEDGCACSAPSPIDPAPERSTIPPLGVRVAIIAALPRPVEFVVIEPRTPRWSVAPALAEGPVRVARQERARLGVWVT